MKEATNIGDHADVLAQLQKKLEEVQEKLKAERARGDKYKKLAHWSRANKTAEGATDTEQIPKPSGSGQIKEYMQLLDDDAKYRSVRDTAILTLRQSQADLMTTWAKQPAELKGKILQLARKREPYLNRFANNWATEALLTQYLRNHINHERRKRNPNSSYNLKRNGSSSKNLSNDDNDEEGDEKDEGEDDEAEENRGGEENGGSSTDSTEEEDEYPGSM